MKTPLAPIAVRSSVAILLGLAATSLITAQDGDEPLQLPVVDQVVAKWMDTMDASAASVAVGVQGEVVFSRGYGHSDRHGEIPTSTRTTMRLASGTKPFTAAAIHILIDQGKISKSTRVFEYLSIRPHGPLGDPRIREITIGHLLDHRGGWNHDAEFDPLYRTERVRRELRTPRLRKRHLVRYMWNEPLDFKPGSARRYSNFGYLLLGLVIEKATGESYIQSIRDLIGERLGVDNLSISSPVPGHRQSREVHYQEESDLNLHLRDSSSGLVTNPETLCRFMGEFWMDGKPRRGKTNRYYYQFGSHPDTTTTLMEQRRDGIDFAVMLNRRRNDHYVEDNKQLRADFNRALDASRNQLLRMAQEEDR